MPVTVEDFGQPVYDMIQPTAWVNLTFAANWQNYGGYTACQMRKRGTQVVEMRGVAQRKTITVTAGQTVDLFTLPAGYFPVSAILIPAICGFASPDICRMDVVPAGKVTVQPRIDLADNAFVGFSGVYWID
jgi:hypothetical protein